MKYLEISYFLDWTLMNRTGDMAKFHNTPLTKAFKKNVFHIDKN